MMALSTSLLALLVAAAGTTNVGQSNAWPGVVEWRTLTAIIRENGLACDYANKVIATRQRTSSGTVVVARIKCGKPEYRATWVDGTLFEIIPLPSTD